MFRWFSLLFSFPCLRSALDSHWSAQDGDHLVPHVHLPPSNKCIIVWDKEWVVKYKHLLCLTNIVAFLSIWFRRLWRAKIISAWDLVTLKRVPIFFVKEKVEILPQCPSKRELGSDIPEHWQPKSCITVMCNLKTIPKSTFTCIPYKRNRSLTGKRNQTPMLCLGIQLCKMCQFRQQYCPRNRWIFRNTLRQNVVHFLNQISSLIWFVIVLAQQRKRSETRAERFQRWEAGTP